MFLLIYKRNTCLALRPAYDFGKIRDGGELRQQAVKASQTVLPDRRIRIVY